MAMMYNRKCLICGAQYFHDMKRCECNEDAPRIASPDVIEGECVVVEEEIREIKLESEL